MSIYLVPEKRKIERLRNNYLLDEVLGCVLPGEGDEGEGLGLIVLHLVYGSDNLDNLKMIIRIDIRPKFLQQPMSKC